MAPNQHPLESVCKLVQPDPPQELTFSSYIDSQVEDQLPTVHGVVADKNDSVLKTLAQPFMVSLEGMKSPALVLDNDLNIIWQNKMALDQLWHHTCDTAQGAPAPFIFDILFNPGFQKVVINWRQWSAYFVRQAMGMMAEETLRRRISRMVDQQKDLTLSLIARNGRKAAPDAAVINLLDQENSSGRKRFFNALAIDTDQGRLFTFEPALEQEKPAQPEMALKKNEKHAPGLGTLSQCTGPVKQKIGVLSACLDNAEVLKTCMLAVEYAALIQDVSNRAIEKVEKFGGIFCKPSDSDFLATFISDNGSEDTWSMRIIECVFELKALMADINREWKLRKSWAYELRLNMAIHSENGYVGMLFSSVGEHLASYGGAVGVASELSHMFGEGQIWATKELIDGLSRSQCDRLRFGYHRSDSHRHRVLVQQCFTRVQDLNVLEKAPCNLSCEHARLAVTQLFDLDLRQSE